MTFGRRRPNECGRITDEDRPLEDRPQTSLAETDRRRLLGTEDPAERVRAHQALEEKRRQQREIERRNREAKADREADRECDLQKSMQIR